MSETTFTFRIDDALKNDFTAAANAHDAWFRRQIEIGQASANAGNLIPADQVEDKFLARRKATLHRFEAK
ncbi:hypothetical protein B5C26_03410 [Photorhabdus luminescens]|uniref:hypothetical protein n=1 Tax=Photorhabdus luminescens TaxID=29488 RepID=UPI000B4DDD60|nr:hypothetical protein [Photorhabdus luminescens]OWO84093.1 hypothetical protein B5C26_03410 [Photorhabdus luminescens]